MILLSYIVQLVFVISGLWNGLEIIVIFWMECLILILISTLRLILLTDLNDWKFDLVIAFLVFLFAGFFWAYCGSAIYNYLWLNHNLSYPWSFTASMAGDVGFLLNYLLTQYGWVFVLILLAIHGIEEVKIYRSTDGYRTVSKTISADTQRYMLTLLVFSHLVYPLLMVADDVSVLASIALVSVRLAIEYMLSSVTDKV